MSVNGEALMPVDVHPVVPAEVRDAAWQFYRNTFDSLKTLAVERHVLHRDEFDDLMTDSRILKYLVRDGDAVVGMAAMTDDLEATPWVSPEYFDHRWPEHYAQRRILYCVFVGVHQGPPGKGVFVALQREMYLRQIQAVDGLAVLDMCTYNEEELRLPWTIESIMAKVAGASRVRRLDNQSYWLYEFPAAS
jgi:hypothetical protein